jgi:hypothetical protein
MEGNMRGPSTADCEKSFIRTGIPTAGMFAGRTRQSVSGLVHIHPAPPAAAEVGLQAGVI